MGETHSIPAFGQVRSGTTNYWVAFVGSGYDNDTARVVGNYYYVIRLDTGAILKKSAISTDVNTSLSSKCPNPYPNIQAVVPGSPSAVDINRDGRTDYVYFGDLDGRLYRVPYTSTNTNSWTPSAIYTDENFYPIITKPAIFPDPTSGGTPLKVLFGTGGDDAAPGDRYYAFISMNDTGSKADVEWYLGNPTALDLAASLKAGEMGVGEKIWSDPVISDKIVYFSSLMGNIENVNPCLNLSRDGTPVRPLRPDRGRGHHGRHRPQERRRGGHREPPAGQQSPPGGHGRRAPSRRRLEFQEGSLHPGIRLDDRTPGAAGQLAPPGRLLAGDLQDHPVGQGIFLGVAKAAEVARN